MLIRIVNKYFINNSCFSIYIICTNYNCENLQRVQKLRMRNHNIIIIDVRLLIINIFFFFGIGALFF